MHLLMLIKTNSAKISALSLINLVGITVSYVALFDCNILFSFRISAFSTNEKLKLDLEVQFSLLAIILGWALCLTIALMNGSLIFSDIRSMWLNCGMLRLVTTLEKNSFKTLAVSLYLLTILSPSAIFIFSFEILLFDNNGLNTVFYFFAKVLHTNFFVIFLSPILEKNVPQLCSLHNSFKQILIHKRRMITSHILLFTRSIMI